MPEESYHDRTEQATPKRREEARQKGHVARSPELNSALVLLAGSVVLYFVAGAMMRQVLLTSKSIFQNLARTTVTVSAIQGYFASILGTVAVSLAPVVGTVMAVGLLSNYLQVGVVFSAEPLTPKFDKLNPWMGMKRLFSLRAVVELVKGLLKVAVVAWVASVTIQSKFPDYLRLSDQGIPEILAFLGRTTFHVTLRCALALLFLAILDYGYQRWEHERSLRMTRQEVREELKETEGDPLIRARIRSIQREMARRRMMKKIPEADVVITNPVHLAVALKYEAEKMNAPVVLAKGARLLAEKIKALAREHDIPIVEDPPLAQFLYKTTEIGMEIPVDAYKAVAEILGYIYRLKGHRVTG